MILTDREIQVALATQQIKIKPTPPADAYSSTRIDLSLDTTICVWKRDVAGVDRVATGEPILAEHDHRGWRAGPASTSRVVIVVS